MDPPDNTYPYTDGTGVGLLGFCAWLGQQGLVPGKEAENLHMAVRRVLGTTDDWQRLDVRSVDLGRRVPPGTGSTLRRRVCRKGSERRRRVRRRWLGPTRREPQPVQV
jgi:hypothetical protein